MKKKIVIIIIIIFIILFEKKVCARYYEQLEKIFIKSEIAEPIIKFENMQETIIINDFNKNIGEKEYFFKIKNYEISEENEKRISEVSFNYFIEIKNKNNNFPVKYKLYDYNKEEMILTNNKTNKFNIEKNKEYEKIYKLVVSWDENRNISNLENNTDIEILVIVSQII